MKQHNGILHQQRDYIYIGVILTLFAVMTALMLAVTGASLPSDNNSDYYDINAGAANAPLPAMARINRLPELMTPDGESVFRVSTGEELSELAASDTFIHYYESHGVEPIVIMSDDIIISGEIVIRGGINLIASGNINWAEDAKISIYTNERRSISVACDENYTRFDIDAPFSALTWSGGDMPFSYEAAQRFNVASYNGAGTAGMAGGDTLGGVGAAKLDGIILYRDKKKTKVADDAYCELAGNTATLYIPHDFTDDDIVSAYIDAKISGDFSGVSIAGTSGAVDLSAPVLITVTDEVGDERTYRLSARRAEYGCPVVRIYTEDEAEITSKTEYVRAVMIIDGEEYPLGIKGRGNASWTQFPKHSYRLKLDDKAKLFGMSADRDWCISGNYGDPSLIRNCVAEAMAKTMSGLEYTPSYQPVDLFLNGEYIGVFLFSDKIEESSDKVNLGDTVINDDGKIEDMGFLIEFGWDYESENIWAKDYFDTLYCKRMYVKDPDIDSANNPEIKYIMNYIKAAERAITTGGNYEDYIDVNSWVDWFLVNELCNNTESVFHRSLYIHKKAGGKLAAGPIWDYDMAFGNFASDIKNYDGWVSVDSTYEYIGENWMDFLLSDPYFYSRVRARWAEMGELMREAALTALDAAADEIRISQIYNFKVWYKVPVSTIGMSTASRKHYGEWEPQIEYIRDFINIRYDWIDKKLG